MLSAILGSFTPMCTVYPGLGYQYTQVSGQVYIILLRDIRTTGSSFERLFIG